MSRSTARGLIAVVWIVVLVVLVAAYVLGALSAHEFVIAVLVANTLGVVSWLL